MRRSIWSNFEPSPPSGLSPDNHCWGHSNKSVKRDPGLRTWSSPSPEKNPVAMNHPFLLLLLPPPQITEPGWAPGTEVGKSRSLQVLYSMLTPATRSPRWRGSPGIWPWKLYQNSGFFSFKSIFSGEVGGERFLKEQRSGSQFPQRNLLVFWLGLH